MTEVLKIAVVVESWESWEDPVGKCFVLKTLYSTVLNVRQALWV